MNEHMLTEEEWHDALDAELDKEDIEERRVREFVLSVLCLFLLSVLQLEEVLHVSDCLSVIHKTNTNEAVERNVQQRDFEGLH